MQRFELSRSQQTVFSMQALQLAGQHFYLGGVARLSGEISLEATTRAAQQVCISQELLRIGFDQDMQTGLWYGICNAEVQSEVETIDLSHHTDPASAFEHWAGRQLTIEEDLTRTPVRIFAVRYNSHQVGWFVKAHHAAADAAALALVMRHLSQALETGSCQSSPAFSLLARNECEYQNSSRFSRDAQYWHGLFGQATHDTTAARGTIGDYRTGSPGSKRIRTLLNQQQNLSLSQFKASGGSLFRLFFAAVAWTQMVVEDSDSVLLQAPMLNRWSEAEKATLAMAIAPVMVPVSRKAGTSAADCYRQLKHLLQKALVHARYAPGARWGEFAAPSWRQVIPAFGVSYQTDEFAPAVAGATVEIDHMQAVEALFATIHIHDRFDGGQIRLEADFRQRWSISQCQAFLQAVLAQAVTIANEVVNQGAATSALPLSATTLSPGIHLLLRQAFARFASNCLFKSADGLQRIDYAQASRKMAQFRIQLARHGYPDTNPTPVLLLGRRLPAVTLAYLACLMENITVVPVCPSSPPGRLQTIARNSGAGLCIHATDDQQLAQSFGIPLLPISADQLDQPLCAPPALDPAPLPMSLLASHPGSCAPGATLTRPAYILYTSGSTGEPKGVAIGAVALAHYAQAATTEYAAARPFNTPLFTSFGFDLTQTAILVPVLSGGFIQTFEADLRDDPALLASLLADEEINAIKCTPSHLALLTEHSSEHRRPRQQPLTFVVGGENLPTSLVQRALAVFPPGSRIINEYGPTETTVGCCIHSVSGGGMPGFDHGSGEPDINAGNTTPIGVALGHACMSIRDHHGQALPPGFQGEIWIGGPVLADSYAGNPEQTAQRFVYTQAHTAQPQRWYRSGDLGLQDAQGVYHCMGRIDDEFKLRGHRIHPAEIEKAVEDALLTVTGRRCELKVLKLMAAGVESIVLCSKQAIPASDSAFQASIHAALPEAWRPGKYCTVPSWPVNANGKLDTAALQAIVHAELASAHASKNAPGQPPSIQSRNWQLPAWLNQAFLQPILSGPIDWDASFLEQGGDSIKAIRLAALLTRQGVRLGAAQLLSMRAIGAILQDACANASSADDPGTLSKQVEADALAFLPASRWLRQQALRHPDRLQQGVVLHLAGAKRSKLTAETIHTAVEAVKARHMVFGLRTKPGSDHFSLGSSQQALRLHTLLPAQTLEQRLLMLQAEVSLQHQASVHEIVCSDDGHCLLWVCHHLLCDVHSWVYLLDELDQALHAILQGNTPPHQSENGAFVWGQFLQSKTSATPAQADSPLHPPAYPVAGATARLALSLPPLELQAMARQLKAERAELVAAALLDLLRSAGDLPAQAILLLENSGRQFAAAGVPAQQQHRLEQAVGWFTGFERIELCNDGEPALLAQLKHARQGARIHWSSRLGIEQDLTAPLICVNDIGHGLSGENAWQHFQLDPALSGGYRHPDENASARFDLLLQDKLQSAATDATTLPAATSTWLELSVAAADLAQVEQSLRALDARLLALHAALHDGRPDALAQQALLPSDFPFSELTRHELDLILHGATA
jgi:amino acid adenylation domain-containing protein